MTGELELVVVRSLDEWAAVIGADLSSAVEGLVNAGLHLQQARAEHLGTFVAWIKSGAVGVGTATAYRLMKIADALSGFSALRSLPPDRLSLYELSRMDRPQLEEAVERGWITPGMRPTEVRQIAASIRTGREPDPGWINGAPQPEPQPPAPSTEENERRQRLAEPDHELAAEDLANRIYDAVWFLAELTNDDLDAVGPRMVEQLADAVRPLVPAVTRVLDLIVNGDCEADT